MDAFDILRAHEDLAEQRALETRLTTLYCQLMRLAADAGAVLAATGRDEHGLHDALAALRGSLLECLRTGDVTRFGAPGDAVDPSRHVVTEWRVQPDNRGRVISVIREGLEWNGRVIMQASVIAAKAADAQTEGRT